MIIYRGAFKIKCLFILMLQWYLINAAQYNNNNNSNNNRYYHDYCYY